MVPNCNSHYQRLPRHGHDDRGEEIFFQGKTTGDSEVQWKVIDWPGKVPNEIEGVRCIAWNIRGFWFTNSNLSHPFPSYSYNFHLLLAKIRKNMSPLMARSVLKKTSHSPDGFNPPWFTHWARSLMGLKPILTSIE